MERVLICGVDSLREYLAVVRWRLTVLGLLSSAATTRPPLGSQENRADVLTFGVADEHIGAVVGRGGKNITEICQNSRGKEILGAWPEGAKGVDNNVFGLRTFSSFIIQLEVLTMILSAQASGAKIKISERGDYLSGTSDRKVTIMGSGAAIRMAEAMILQKISSVSVSER
ncbi:hypothetical protein ACLOJK_025265 [Asimina triloba]